MPWRDESEKMFLRAEAAEARAQAAEERVAALTEKLRVAREALVAARHQLVAAFGVLRSHAGEEHVQHYQRAMMLCDAVLAEKEQGE